MCCSLETQTLHVEIDFGYSLNEICAMCMFMKKKEIDFGFES